MEAKAGSPCRRSHPRDPIVWGNLAFVNLHFRKATSFLVPIEGVRRDRRNIDISAKVSRQVTKVRALLYDGAVTD